MANEARLEAKAREANEARLEAIVAVEYSTELETSSNSDDEDNVPIAQQLGLPPRLQESGDALPLPTHVLP